MAAILNFEASWQLPHTIVRKLTFSSITAELLMFNMCNKPWRLDPAFQWKREFKSEKCLEEFMLFVANKVFSAYLFKAKRHIGIKMTHK